MFLAPLAISAAGLRSVSEITRHLEQMEYMNVMAPELSCTAESGFDYVGYDMLSVSSNSNGCCWQCFIHAGCKAYSWKDVNGGTRYLKSRRGQIVVDPNVRSALMLFGKNPVCQLQEEINYEGNDIANVTAAAAEDCCDICHSHSGCRAFS